MSLPFLLLIGVGPGIGMAVARRFAREGFRIGLIAHPEAPLEAFQRDLEALGAPSLVLPADLASPSDRGEALRTLLAWGGTPELMVYHAAGGARGPLAERSEAELLEALEINVQAPLACVRAVLTGMRIAAKGTLLFSGGGLALAPKPGEGLPALGKAGLRHLALSLAQELASEQLHVATVTIAGWVQPETPFNPDFVAEAYWELYQEPRERWRAELLLRPQ